MEGFEAFLRYPECLGKLGEKMGREKRGDGRQDGRKVGRNKARVIIIIVDLFPDMTSMHSTRLIL